MNSIIDFLKSISSPNVAAIRHALTVVFTLLATVGVISVTGTPKVIDQIVTVIQAGGVIAGAIATFLGIVVPIINAWYASWSAQDKQQIKRVEEIANDPSKPRSIEAKAAILDAAASLPEVTTPIKVDDPTLANLANSPLVKTS